MSLLRAVATVSGFTMMSRITGFARDILIASILGAGPIADAFFIAFKFPNFFRRLTAEGAFTVAFVPTFSRLLQDKGKKDALEFAEEVISIMGIGLFLFSFFVLCQYFLIKTGHRNPDKWIPGAESFVFVR